MTRPLDPVPQNDWAGVHPGIVTEPMPPWKPLAARADGDGVTVTIFRHELHFGESLLPDRVVSFGDALTAAPWYFVVEAGGETLPLETMVPVKLEAE